MPIPPRPSSAVLVLPHCRRTNWSNGRRPYAAHSAPRPRALARDCRCRSSRGRRLATSAPPLCRTTCLTRAEAIACPWMPIRHFRRTHVTHSCATTSRRGLLPTRHCQVGDATQLAFQILSSVSTPIASTSQCWSLPERVSSAQLYKWMSGHLPVSKVQLRGWIWHPT